MRIKLTELSVLVFLVTVGCMLIDGQNLSPGLGSVQGQVVDAGTEQPIANARVTAWPEEGSAAKLISADTDSRGKFLLEGLPAGTYELAAAKELDWYPDTRIAAFGQSVVISPKVVIQEGNKVNDITIRLEKGGRIVGTVRDSETHEPVVDSRLRLFRADKPNLWTSIDPDDRGYFQIVVPSTGFRIAVSAPGYQRWALAEVRPNGRDVLRVSQQATYRLSIQLKKE